MALKGTADFFNLIYPVGSIYMSMNSTNPHDLFGGTWEQIKSRFLVGTGSIEANTNDWCGSIEAGLYNFGQNSSGEMAGEVVHTLSVDEMPYHNHGLRSGEEGSTTYGEYGPIYTSNRNKYQLYTLPIGGNQPHNNLPPYLTVYMWKRTA